MAGLARSNGVRASGQGDAAAIPLQVRKESKDRSVGTPVTGRGAAHGMAYELAGLVEHEPDDHRVVRHTAK